jgi:DNA (cytosine-5)-methyltransferase 1
MNISAIDLFCGIGGLSYGFKQEGINILAGFDSDTSCKFAFETNIEADFHGVDVAKLRGRELKKLFTAMGGYSVLIGCAPCQPFSTYTKRYRKEAGSSDDRWQLLKEFSRLVQETRPHIVSMENVPRLTTHAVFAEFVQSLKELGYRVSYGNLRAERFGVPQRRTRLVLFASLFGPVELPKETHKDKPRTVRDAIGSLPPIRAGETSPRDRIHRGRNLTPLNLSRIRATKEGGSWKDWKPELQLRCHKKAKGKTFRSVYGRMRWDEPSPVITTQCLGIGNGRFGHPSQDRGLSIREAALLQSFPMKFRFVEHSEQINGRRLAQQIGNAVPVRLSRAIARAIKKHLDSVL